MSHFSTRRKDGCRTRMKRMSESHHTWRPPRTAIRAGVFSAASILTFAAPAGSRVNKHTAKHVKFRVAHLHTFATFAPPYRERHCQWQPPRGVGNGVLRRPETGWFAGLTRSSAK